MRVQITYPSHLFTCAVLKDELAPLDTLRSIIIDRLYEQSPTIGPDQTTLKRTNPELGDFTGKSMSKRPVEEILCEFAHKLDILHVSSYNNMTIDYSQVTLQSRQLEPRLADSINQTVVRNIGTNDDLAREYAESFWPIAAFATGPEPVGASVNSSEYVVFTAVQTLKIFSRFFRARYCVDLRRGVCTCRGIYIGFSVQYGRTSDT